MMRLKRNFYIQPTLKTAKALLGKFIVRQIGNQKIIGKIVETEAYIGPKDQASHAFSGKKTDRNRAEFLIGGHIYIYLVYGMYWQLNISTSKESKPECVLIRALEPVEGIELGKKTRPKAKSKKELANGPGKLCQFLHLNQSFYGVDLTKSKKIWLEDRGIKIKSSQIITCPRVGIDYAGHYWSQKPWRFYVKDSQFVSKVKR